MSFRAFRFRVFCGGGFMPENTKKRKCYKKTSARLTSRSCSAILVEINHKNHTTRRSNYACKMSFMQYGIRL